MKNNIDRNDANGEVVEHTTATERERQITALSYLSDKGYGSGSNYTTNIVAEKSASRAKVDPNFKFTAEI